jgi:hypothetical protein
MIIFGGSGDSLYNDVWRLTGMVTGASGPSSQPILFELHQNYPNPFNPVTRITYTVVNRQHIRLNVYNILGETVAGLVDEMQDAGDKAVDWDAGEAASGIYVVRLQAPGVAQTRKMVLAR